MVPGSIPGGNSFLKVGFRVNICLATILIEKLIRMRESYKRFVKTWIRFANPWIRMDSQTTNPDSFRIVGHESSHFQKIRFADSFRDAIFKRFDKSNESNESSRILSTIDLRIRTNPYESLGFGFANLYGVQKIRFVDSFRTTVFKRFVLWICFVKIIFPNYSIRFVSEGFVYESRILRN